MGEELGYEVTPKQSLDGLWKTMHKYIEHHGYSDISLEIEGSYYEFRQHLQKYDECEDKAEEEITDDTVFETLVIVRNDDEVHISRNDSMSMYDKDQTKEFHALIDGKLELVWEVDRDEL